MTLGHPQRKAYVYYEEAVEGDVTTLSQAIKSQRRCTWPEKLLAKEPAFGMSTGAQHSPKWCQAVLPGIPSLGSYLWGAVRLSTGDRRRTGDLSLPNCCLAAKAGRTNTSLQRRSST